MRKKDKSLNTDNGAPTLIGANSSFEGNYKGKESICVEGEYKGNLEAGENVFINKGAHVQADIFANYVMVHGTVHGNITASEAINIGSTGEVNGDVAAPSLTVATGGYLNGRCRMLEQSQGLPTKEEHGKLDSWKAGSKLQSSQEVGELDSVASSDESSYEDAKEGTA